MRLDLLPLLAREWNPGIEDTLAQTAEWARAEEEYWDGEMSVLARTHLRTERCCTIAATSAFSSLQTAAARRLIRSAIASVKGDLRLIDFLHVEQIRALICGSENGARLQVPGVDVMRSFDWVRFAPPNSYAGDRRFSTPVSVPGEFILTPAGSTLSLQVEDADYRYNEDVNRLDAQSITGRLVLRTWQPGDRYCPNGRSTDLKVKELFQAARIPLWDRASWPVLAIDEDIVWSRRFGASASHAARPDSRRIVQISESCSDKLMTVSPKLESGTRRPTSIG
jgi:tRNA(Ile)-lysidine synthase